MHVVFITVHCHTSTWITHDCDTIFSERILLLFFVYHVAATRWKRNILTARIKLRNTILCCLRKICCNNTLIELKISVIIWFVVFIVVIANQDNSNVFLIWSYFWWLCMGKRSHSRNHLMTDISWKFIRWALIRISYPLILGGTIMIAHRVIVMVLCNTNISIALRHSDVFVIVVCVVLSSSYTNALHHWVTILVSNSVFGCLEFLVFDEVGVSSVHLDVWAVVSTVRLNLLCILFPVGLYQLFFFITLWLSWSSDENDIALVDSSIIGAAMWPLFIISSVIGPTSLILYSNWIPTHVLWRLVEIEKTWPIALRLTSCSSNVSKLMRVRLVVTSISHKRIIVCV